MEYVVIGNRSKKIVKQFDCLMSAISWVDKQDTKHGHTVARKSCTTNKLIPVYETFKTAFSREMGI